MLLGVGMAGKAHWSATIEGDSMTEAIAFDMACRTSSLPLQLGSSYSIESSWRLVDHREHSVKLQHPDGFGIVTEHDVLGGRDDVPATTVDLVLQLSRCPAGIEVNGAP